MPKQKPKNLSGQVPDKNAKTKRYGGGKSTNSPANSLLSQSLFGHLETVLKRPS